MKRTSYYLFLLIIGYTLSCTNKNKSNNTNMTDTPETISTAPDSTNITTIDAAYNDMQNISLPITVNSKSVGKTTGMKRLVSSLFEQITFTPQGFKNVYAAKLPEYGNTRAILVSYKDSLNNPVEELITFKPDFKFVDRTRLYAIDRVNGKDNQQIVTQSEVKAPTDIHIEQYLNGTLISSLHYQLNDDGSIEEIRDGKTPAVIFESFDNETYFIENFVWQTLSNGGVRKTNLTKKTYKVAADGQVKEVKP